MTLTFNFLRSLWTLLYLSTEWSDSHETKSKQCYRLTQGLKCDHQVWPWPWPWLWIFKVKYEFLISQPEMIRLPWNEKQTYQLNFRPQMWHQIWPWPWPWPWIFRVKYGICYISTKSGPIAMKRKANISIELQASNVTNGFDLVHDLDLWIFKVKCDLDLWPHAWPWPRIFMVKFGNSCISEWEGWLTLNQGGGSRSFMTMTMTNWWPRSGVMIYQIVTGVTSDVSVLLTHLVYLVKVDVDKSIHVWCTYIWFNQYFHSYCAMLCSAWLFFNN